MPKTITCTSNVQFWFRNGTKYAVKRSKLWNGIISLLQNHIQFLKMLDDRASVPMIEMAKKREIIRLLVLFRLRESDSLGSVSPVVIEVNASVTECCMRRVASVCLSVNTSFESFRIVRIRYDHLWFYTHAVKTNERKNEKISHLETCRVPSRLSIWFWYCQNQQNIGKKRTKEKRKRNGKNDTIFFSDFFLSFYLICSVTHSSQCCRQFSERLFVWLWAQWQNENSYVSKAKGIQNRQAKIVEWEKHEKK